MRDGIISVLFGFEWQHFSRINSGVPYAPVVSLSRWGSKYSTGLFEKKEEIFSEDYGGFSQKIKNYSFEKYV